MNDAHFKMTIELPCGHVMVHEHVVNSAGLYKANDPSLWETSGVFGFWLLYSLPRHRCELVTKENQYGLTSVDKFGVKINWVERVERKPE